jgi:DNA invertase Pin-like site-specific DNA recombinase
LAASKGYKLDKSLTFRDIGVSAYRGKNAADGALRAFVAPVEDGRVPQGSFLVVESLDRISRQAVREAARTLEDLCEAALLKAAQFQESMVSGRTSAEGSRW